MSSEVNLYGAAKRNLRWKEIFRSDPFIPDYQNHKREQKERPYNRG